MSLTKCSSICVDEIYQVHNLMDSPAIFRGGRPYMKPNLLYIRHFIVCRIT